VEEEIRESRIRLEDNIKVECSCVKFWKGFNSFRMDSSDMFYGNGNKTSGSIER
jgi:hypothetical protein